MTQTTPSHSQAVEAAERRLSSVLARSQKGTAFWSEITEAINDFKSAITSQQEVAAPADIDWEPLEEIPRERQQFDRQVETFGSPQLAIATALHIWGAMSPGGSYSAQCNIMANEVAKLAASRVPVVQGEAVFEVGFGWLKPADHYPRGTLLYATPANMAVGTSSEVGAEIGIKRWRKDIENGPVAVFYTDLINGEMVHRDDIWLVKTSQLATPAPEQATTGSGQVVTDAERYQWLRNIADPDAEDTGIAVSETYLNDWGKFCTRYFAGDELDKAIDAAILSTASPAGEGEVKP